MIRIFKLVLLLVVSQVAFGQAPSNYTNINGRYRWIAGMFDSTFHIPKGTTTSLRTGGSTNAGALFYRTTDSSVYYYTGTQWLKVAGASGFVPYTGATQNVNLGQFGLKTKYVEFDTSSQAVTDRRLQWSNAEGTIQFGMTNGSTITQRIGLEQFARVRNLQGDTIEAGDVVYISGASGDRASVKLADNRADSTSSKTLGVATEQILPNDVGLIGTFGVVGKLNLSAFTAGDVVYLDSIPGKLTKVKPQAPYHMVFVGIVERANAGNGLLFVNVQNGYELEELHNVRITSPTNGQVLAYYNNLWRDTTIAAAGLAVTQVNTNANTGITGGPITTTGTIAADTVVLSTRLWRQKGIDSVQSNLTAGLALKLNISDTASMLSPYLRSATASSTYVPLTRTITINGTSQDLSANRTYSVGTVTSITGGTGLTGGAITTSGTLAVDTNLISTRLWRQKGIDSVAALANTKIGGSGTAGYLAAFNTSSTITNSLFYDSGTNIGLGTTSPLNILDIVRDSLNYPRIRNLTAKSAALYIQNSATGTNLTDGLSIGIDKVGNGIITQNDGNQLLFDIATTTKLTINSTGVAAGPANMDSSFNAGSSSFSQGVRMSGLPTGVGTKALRINANGTLSVADTLANGMSGSGTTNYIPKFTSSSAIGNSVIYETSSNIGIGTTSTGFNSAGLPLIVGSGSGNTGMTIFSGSSSYGSIHFADAETTGAASYAGYINYEHIGNSMQFGTNSNERMRLNASGNLGLATTTIGSTLQVNGNAAIGYSASTAAPTNGLAVSGQLGVGTNTPNASFAAEIAGSIPLLINSTNTATSTGFGALQIFRQTNTVNQGNGIVIGLFNASNAIVEYGYIGALIEANTASTQSGSLLFMPTSSGTRTERMRITSGGNVGIGTTAPSAILDIDYSTGGALLRTKRTGVAGEFQLYQGSNLIFLDAVGASANLVLSTNSNERMRITSGGEVYIAGTTDQGAYNLQVNGTGVWGAGAYVNGSDIRLKENIKEVGSALSLVNQLKPKTYTYKESYSSDRATQIGFIAQDLEEVLKDQDYKGSIVVEGKEYKSVAYQNLIPLLVKAIQEQQIQIENLKKQIK